MRGETPVVSLASVPDPQNIDLRDIDPLEVSLTFAPANRWPRLFAKSAWASSLINDLPDSAFLYIEPGGEKDDGGKTTPRTQRHFPYRNKDGSVDLPHLRNAISRLPQSDIPKDKIASLQERAQKLLEGENDKEKSMSAKSMSAKAKDACAKFAKSLDDLKEEMPEKAFGKLQKALAFEGKETEEEEELEKVKKSAAEATTALAAKTKAHDEAVAALTGAKGIAKKSMELLEGDKPDLPAVVQQLSPLAGVMPKSVLIAQLPPELRAEVETLKKSAADSAKALEEMAKSQAAQIAATRKVELVSKAATQYPLVPGAKPEDIAALQMALPEASLPTLKALLDATQGAMAKSELFIERGTAASRAYDATGGGAGPRQMGGSTAHEKVVQMAREMVQKSDNKLTEAQAVVKIYMQHPEMYAQHEAENPPRNVAP